ncbi:response regulator [Methylobacterium oxalidis]|uniref:Response regulator n=1 Tax=Methylobacterium oxalidis TaxID=944322 RepID=A0A512J2V8_9HYPH|nr:response regulator [Methylobacterium oxalidis]GEP04243.1 response regulator [Methylobacterium oxalidis]GJE30682.1 Alginate biosynthesis transcriptional regulatory protein AlgB [Methylobacterium oxalidis]GLS66629.1 response regulator [Methylobacterium oxalidis]
MHTVTNETTSPENDRPVILLVEDEALTIMDLGDVLENGGYETVQCASAERALSILQARPDICGLVTDVELSGRTNGFDLANSVAEARPHLPIVIVSGRAAPDPDRMPAGARFIARPCSGEDILDQLRSLLPC